MGGRTPLRPCGASSPQRGEPGNEGAEEVDGLASSVACGRSPQGGEPESKVAAGAH